MFGLRRFSAATLVPNWVAIEDSVSPGLTVHLTCWPVLADVVVAAGVVSGVVVCAVEAAVVVTVVTVVAVCAVVAGGGGGGGGAGCGGGGSGGGAVCGTESVCTGADGPVAGGGLPSDTCPRTPALERISVMIDTAPSSAAGAR